MFDEHVHDVPLVTIGLPTYNRADLLKLAIEKIINQTWLNIEIVISDNASSDPRVAQVIADYAKRDVRIRPYRQTSNVGVLRNFLFVLEQARGDYFMWAADDDEWAPDFVEFGVRNIGSAGLIMGDFDTVYHASNEVIRTSSPKLDPNFPVLQNVDSFCVNMQPTLIYGLHRTNSLRDSIPATGFFFWDCAVLYSILLNHGIKTVEGSRYRAGIHTKDYEIKPINPAVRQLTYWPFFSQLIRDTFKCHRLSFRQKVSAAATVTKMVRELRAHHNRRKSNAMVSQ